MVRHRPNRTGFTLVELLIVILIIAGLIAILVPTVLAAFRKAKEAQVGAEMSNLATALASFKNTYGDYPPSRVILFESGFGSLPAAFLSATVGSPAANSAFPPPPLMPPTIELPLADAPSTDMTNQQLVQRSLLYLRKFWPRADFVNPIAQYNNGVLVQGTWNDFDGDGQVTPYPIVLNGSECLTFFLGGISIRGQGTTILGLSGFSRTPRYPFVSTSAANNGTPAAPNRSVPNFEFNNGRLIDQDGDGIPSYLDPINVNPGSRRSYAYFVSYGVNGYDPNDVNKKGEDPIPPDTLYELEDDDSTIVERGFLVNFPVYDASTTQQPLAVSPAPNPYTSSPPASGTVAWFNPTSFQLICSGQDGYWGLGGTYNSGGAAAVRVPIVANPADPGNVHADDTTGVRLRERDNLTNFGGRLD